MRFTYEDYLSLKSLSFDEAINKVADGDLVQSLESIDWFYNKPELITLSNIPNKLFNLDNVKSFKAQLTKYFNGVKEAKSLNVYGMPTITVTGEETGYGAQGDEYEVDLSATLTIYRGAFFLNNAEKISIEDIMSEMKDALHTSTIYVENLNFDYILRKSLERHLS